MDRRRFLVISLASGLLGTPGSASGQPRRKVYRIALIASGAPPSTPPGEGPLYERLRELGWTYGRDFVAEQRAYGDRMDRIPGLAAEMIQTGVDVFIVEGATDAARVQQVTRTIPIVTLRAGDLVEAGLAASLARPGGNVTGVQTLQPELAAKHLSLLKESIPRFSKSGILFEGPSVANLGRIGAAVLREAEVAANALGVALRPVTVDDPAHLERVLAALQAEGAQALIVMRSQYLSTHGKTLADLAVKHRLPTICDAANFATRGGLMSYGYSSREAVRTAAEVVDQILHGTKAGDIPIRQATAFNLVINLKTAKARGLTLPPSLLARADQVIQ